jgi:hypothetical protein
VNDVPQDGLCGQQHHNTEDKSADGVRQVPAGVILVPPDQRTRNRNPDALQNIPDHMQHRTAQIDAAVIVPVVVAVVVCVTAGGPVEGSSSRLEHHSWGRQLAADLNLMAALARNSAAAGHCVASHAAVGP